jgi:mannan endo-1,4-beta-mannosidase
VGWRWDTLRSDVKDLTGSFPGVYGWDYESIPQNEYDKSRHPVPRLAREAYSRGGINTFSWHMRNPVTYNFQHDTTAAVKEILAGGEYYERYLSFLDSMVEYTNQMVNEDGEPIPIIFRQFHEFDGNWFWWGKSHCTREEFIKLWRITLDYLRKNKKVRNLLYAYSSDRKFLSEEDYLECYPGDEYVDIFGLDDYYDFSLGTDSAISMLQKKLKIISTVAEKKQKIAAFTETGMELVPDTNWWTQKLYKVLDDDSVKIAYVLLWRNLHPWHFYVPYRGHPSEKDFIEFRNKPKMLFESDLPDMYRTWTISDIIAKIKEGEDANGGK